MCVQNISMRKRLTVWYLVAHAIDWKISIFPEIVISKTLSLRTASYRGDQVSEGTGSNQSSLSRYSHQDRIKIRECPRQCGVVMAWILPTICYGKRSVWIVWAAILHFCGVETGTRWALSSLFLVSYHKSVWPRKWWTAIQVKTCRDRSLQATAVCLLPQSKSSKGTGFSSRFGRGFYN